MADGSSEIRIRSARPRVLLIDDDDAVLRAFARLLKDHYAVVSAESGEQARGIFEDGAHFDVIICDFSMPGEDGLSLYNWLLAHHPQLASRVVFLSGGAPSVEDAAFLAALMTPVLSKPVAVAELRSVIDAVVRRRDVAAPIGATGRSAGSRRPR